MEFKVKDGQIIYYRDLGKGFPIVFLHGNNLSRKLTLVSKEFYIETIV